MKLYNFKRLIQKYSVDFTLVRISGGEIVSGKWEHRGEERTEMRGAIVPMGERKIYSSGGAYTAQDRELYLTKPLKGALSDFRVVQGVNTYSVENCRDFESYADVAVYTLKWVSKSDQTQKE